MVPARRTNARTTESGSATVEFAFVILPLFAILFMTINVAWIIFGSACIEEAAREGERYAVTGSGQSESTLPASLDGTSQATAVGNIVKVTVQGVTIGSFGPLFRTWSSLQLFASASDVMQ